MAERVINMIMLGPRGVGKSSLLATMYREISKLGTGFDVMPGDETHNRLDEAYHNLSRVTKDGVFAPVRVSLPGTSDFIEHRFEVVFDGIKEFDVFFHDFRGGAMMEAGPDLDRLREKVARSHVIFNVLDSVALMEVDAIRGDELNGHDRVHTLLTRTLQGDEKYLIVFVLVKCETYVNTATARERLLDRFEERHRSVLRLIERLNESKKNVAAIVIPAVTLGCVTFREIDQDGNFVFIRNQRDFQPREVDQPLRYALGFALTHVQENQSITTALFKPGVSIFKAVLDTLSGRRAAFATALATFLKERRNGYRKYGNFNVLG